MIFLISFNKVKIEKICSGVEYLKNINKVFKK